MHAQFRREDSPEWIARKWPVDARGDHYLLDGLRPRTRYLFRFAAENEVGIGDWSAERAVWTEREGRPERPLFRNLNADAQTREVVSPFGGESGARVEPLSRSLRPVPRGLDAPGGQRARNSLLRAQTDCRESKSLFF